MKLIDKMIEKRTSIEILEKQVEELKEKLNIDYEKFKEEYKITIWHSIDKKEFWFEDGGVRNSSYYERYNSMVECLKAVKKFLEKEE